MPKFDRYEIAHVAEYKSDREGFTFCEPLHGKEPEGNFIHVMWTLYGHIKGEGVRAIADYDDYASCVEMYELITGDHALTGADIYN